MSNETLLDRLRAELGADAVVTDVDVMATYSRDQMPLAPAGTPLAVVLPEDVDGVRATVRACAAARVPVVPRGAGSGLSGGANAVDGCVGLVTQKLHEIVAIHPENHI